MTKTNKKAITGTILQQRATKLFLESLDSGRFRSIGGVMKQAGYSGNTALNPTKLTESKYFKTTIKELTEGLEIDKYSRLKRLAEIFYSKDKRSALEANKEITKLLGEYAPTKYQNLTAGEAINRVYEEID